MIKLLTGTDEAPWRVTLRSWLAHTSAVRHVSHDCIGTDHGAEYPRACASPPHLERLKPQAGHKNCLQVGRHQTSRKGLMGGACFSRLGLASQIRNLVYWRIRALTHGILEP